MPANLERFRKDLDRLVQQGDLLEQSMHREVFKDDFEKAVRSQLGKEHAEAYLKKIPPFSSAYEAWYSESLALLRQLLPDRVGNFVSMYEKPRVRKELNSENYVIRDYLQGLKASFAGQVVVDRSAAMSLLGQQVAIVKAAVARFDSSLFEIRQLVQADLCDSEIEVARELLKAKFLRAAGAVAGVVLEKHLVQVCIDHKIAITKKSAGIADLNELLKSNSVIDVPQWRHTSLLADIRNLCVHNKKVEPTEAQVVDLISGAEKVLKTIS